MGPTRQRRIEQGSRSQLGHFALAKGDIAIFGLLHEFRFLRRDHFVLLTGRSPKRLHRRLLRLVQGGYVMATCFPQQKHIYSLGRSGVAVLVINGLVERDTARERLRTSELKELFLKHEMMIVDQHVTLHLAGRNSPLQLVRWEEARGLFDTVTVTNGHKFEKLPVRPDAFFSIEDRSREPGKNRFDLFLELDRSTMPHAAFQEKLRAYQNYREQGKHAKKLSIQTFRVLTLTLTQARAENLCAMAARMLPESARKTFLFGAAGRFPAQDPRAVYDCKYLTPRSPGTMLPLIPTRTDP